MGTVEVTYRDGSRVVRVVLPVHSCPDELVERIVAMGGTSREVAHYELSDREHEVARYVRMGWSNRRIAAELGIAEGTVKRHVSNILEKSGLESRTQLALALGA